jgi:hypothetical protein
MGSIAAISDNAADGGGSERRVDTKGGKKDYRYPEIESTDRSGKKHYHNIGKTNKNGAPPKRERDALDDLQKTGNNTTYTPYNN